MKNILLSFLFTSLFVVAGETAPAPDGYREYMPGGTNDAQINGTIGFSGTISLDTTSAGTATEVTGWHFAGTAGSPYVSVATGDFSPVLGMSTTFATPWHFAMPVGPTIPSFWSVGTFTFDLMTSTIVSQGIDQNGNGYVHAVGQGILHGVGFDATPWTWSFTTQDPAAGGVFSFSASGTAVPEPSTGALIAAGALLVGIASRIGSRKRASDNEYESFCSALVGAYRNRKERNRKE